MVLSVKRPVRKRMGPEEIALLHELSRELLVCMLNRHQVISLALRYLSQVVPCQVGGFLLENKASPEQLWRFTARVYHPGSENLVTDLAQRVLDGARTLFGDPIGLDKASTVIEAEGQPDGVAPQSKADLVSFVALPVAVEERIIGMIGVGSAKADAFDSRATRLLASIADHVAIAINSNRLLEDAVLEKQRLQAAINHMSDGVMMLDEKRRVAIFNAAMERMTGLRAADVIGRPVEELQPLLDFIKQMVLPEKPQLGHEEVPRVLEVYPTPVIWNANRYWGEVQVIHDVTQERELARMKSEFVANVSHELRTPLHSIRGFNKLILEGKVPFPETQKEFLTIIDQQGEHLSKLVEELLDVSSIEVGRFAIQKRRVSIEKIIQSAVAGLHGLANERGVAIEIDLPKMLPDVHGDEERLRQVVINLVGNAIKFSPDGGSIVVSGVVKDNSVLVQVIDHGFGIPPEAMPRLFHRFYQAKNSMPRGGTGLGLYIAKQIVERHEGRIWVESQVGQGSTFSFTVPLYPCDGGVPDG